MDSTSRPLGVKIVALTIVGLVAISSTLYIERNHHAGTNLRQPGVHIDPPNHAPQQFPRRRLLSTRPEDQETQEKQMKSYLGGLYPPVNNEMMPLYLRDTLEEGGVVMDYSSGEAKMKSTDVYFFWHVPRVRSYFALFVKLVYFVASLQ